MKPTREQILEASNKDLNEWVAMSIMKWAIIRGHSHLGYPPSRSMRTEPGNITEVPLYSTQITAAWQVHERMCKESHANREDITYNRRQAREYFDAITKVIGARVHEDDRWKIGWPTCFGYLEPEDICRAALLAVLEDDN